MDCAAALRHDCATATCNSPSASQGPGRTNANGTPAKKKKKVFSSSPPRFRFIITPKSMVIRLCTEKASESESTPRNVQRKPNSKRFTSHSQPRGPKISVSVSVSDGQRELRE